MAMPVPVSDRAGSAVVAAIVTMGLGYALMLGLAVRTGEDRDAPESVFALAPPPVPEATRTTPVRRHARRPEGEAAPSNLRSRSTVVTAPVPVVTIPVEPLLPVAERQGLGRDATSGAADVPGPGAGAGGMGEGSGAGGDGDGDGGIAGHTPPRQVRGRLRDADYPRDLADAGIGGRVRVRYRVEIDGRVSECAAIESSGIARLDAMTCRMIRERFRFRPSRDERGRAVPSTVHESHEWVFERLPPEGK